MKQNGHLYLKLGRNSWNFQDACLGKGPWQIWCAQARLNKNGQKKSQRAWVNGLKNKVQMR